MIKLLPRELGPKAGLLCCRMWLVTTVISLYFHLGHLRTLEKDHAHLKAELAKTQTQTGDVYRGGFC